MGRPKGIKVTRRLTGEGYVLVYLPTHHRAWKGRCGGWVREHIAVWEQANNQKLPDGWVIHHLNGVKGDNRPRNLLALPRQKHHGDLVLQALKQRIRELEAEAKLLERTLDANQMIFRFGDN